MDCFACKAEDLNVLIFESTFWRVTLSSDQRFLGRSYATLKRHAGDLAELSQEEWLDLADVIKRFESALRKSFPVSLFNWGCLMNHAFQKKPYNPHVHWHIRPRYEKKVDFEGIVFEDKEFGHHYISENTREIPMNVKEKIIQKIKENLK